MRQSGLDGFPFQLQASHRDYYLQYTNFLTLSNKKRIFGRDCRSGCVHKKGCENEGFFKKNIFFKFIILCIEDRVLIDRMSNFKRWAVLNGSAFRWVACLTHKVLSSAYTLITNFIALLAIYFGIHNTCGGAWLNGVGQNRETSKECDKNCVEEEF